VALDARHQSWHTARALLADSFYAGDVALVDADLGFHADGVTLLWRDVRRWGYLLFASEASLTEAQSSRRQKLLADVRALVPFSLLVANTWPLTPGVMRAILGEGGWAAPLRAVVVPSAFEEARLRVMRRLRDKQQRRRQ
jgi:hypothetical protein